MEFGLGLKRAEHLFAVRIDEALRPLGLNLGLWAVMREVARTPGASASELARASFNTPQTLGGLLQRLQARGLVERSTGRGRIVENHLTPEGARTLRQATATAEAVIHAALAQLDALRAAQAQQFLSDLAAAIMALPNADDPSARKRGTPSNSSFAARPAGPAATFPGSSKRSAATGRGPATRTPTRATPLLN